MGPIGDLLGHDARDAGQMKDQMANIDDRDLDRTAAIIQSMTPAGAAGPEDHQRLPPGPDRQRLRVAGPGQRPGGAVLRGPQDDAVDGRRDRPAGLRNRPPGAPRRAARASLGRGPTPPKVKGGIPPRPRQHAGPGARRAAAGIRWAGCERRHWRRDATVAAGLRLRSEQDQAPEELISSRVCSRRCDLPIVQPGQTRLGGQAGCQRQVEAIR